MGLSIRSDIRIGGMVQRGARLNLLQRVLAWQNTNDTVRVGGLKESTWIANNTWFSNGRTIIIPRRAIYSKTTIQSIRIYPNQVSGAAWKLKLFRWNSTTSLYDFLRESTFTPVGTVAQTCVLDPLEADVTDIVGLYIPPGNTIWSYDSGPTNPATRGVTGVDVVSSNAFSLTYDPVPCIDVFGSRPFLAIGADSIASGFNQGSGNYYYPIWATTALAEGSTRSIPGGNQLSEPGHIVKNIIGSFLSYQNHGNTNTTWADAVSNYVPKLLAAKPHTVVLAWGTNDIFQGITWATVLGQLNAIKVLFDASSSQKLMICEILPRTQFNDAQAATTRTWNTNFAEWCTANGATLIQSHDAMGQVRPSTGQIDDLKPPYTSDTTHLTELGVGVFGATIANYIK